MKDANEVIERALEEYENLYEHVRPAADWFHEREGKMIPRREAMTELKQELDVHLFVANETISELVGDQVDPIVQVINGTEKYVGIIDYEEGDGWYAYTDYHDKYGERERVVCAQCVHDAEYDTEVTTATEHEGSFGGATREELVEGVLSHYEEAHDEKPEDVETGASLLSGTTIGGNTAFHAGNDGPGSGLDADTVDGFPGSDLKSVGSAYGTGHDGSITRSTNGTENGLIFATDYTIESGVTMTVDSGVVVIHATDSITIDGTLDATAQGAAGGTNSQTPAGGAGGAGKSTTNTDGDPGGNGGNGTGQDGTDALYGASGGSGGASGGTGGAPSNADSGSGDGGQGGDGGNSTGGAAGNATSGIDNLGVLYMADYETIYDLTAVAGAGGGAGGAGGGGGGGGGGGKDSGGNGGDGGDGGDGAPGGDGGDGGGVIYLAAPQINISGQVLARGEDGQNAPETAGDGQDGTSASGPEGGLGGTGFGGGGGGGGGGAGDSDGDGFNWGGAGGGGGGGAGNGGGGGGGGGAIITVTVNLNATSSEFDVSGGTGGSGGAGGTAGGGGGAAGNLTDASDGNDGNAGGNGGNGSSGLLVNVGDGLN